MKFAVNNKTNTKYFPLWVPFQHGANGKVEELWVICKDSFCISYRENCELDIIFTEMTDGEVVNGRDLAVPFEFQELLAAVATENREDPLAEMLTQYIKLDFPENGVSKEIDADEITRRKQLFVEWFDQMAEQLSDGACRYFFEGINEPFGGKEVLTASQQFQITRFLDGASTVFNGICRKNAEGGMNFVALSELIESQCQETELTENPDGNTLLKNLEIFCDYYTENHTHYIGVGKKRYGRRENVSVCRYVGKGNPIVKIPPMYSGTLVSRIDEDAFRECDMEEIYIPSGVEIIGNHAFEDCLNLKKIHLPMGIRQLDIETLPIGCVLVTEVVCDVVKELCFSDCNIHEVTYELEDGTVVEKDSQIPSEIEEVPQEETNGFTENLSTLSEEISDLLVEVEQALDKSEKSAEEVLIEEKVPVDESAPAVEEETLPEEVAPTQEEELPEEEISQQEEVLLEGEVSKLEEELPEEVAPTQEEASPEEVVPTQEEELPEEVVPTQEELLLEEEVLELEEELPEEVVPMQEELPEEVVSMTEEIKDPVADKLAELEAILEARGLTDKKGEDKISIQIPEEKEALETEHLMEEMPKLEHVNQESLMEEMPKLENVDQESLIEEIDLAELMTEIAKESVDRSADEGVELPVEEARENTTVDFEILDIMPELNTNLSQELAEEMVVEELVESEPEEVTSLEEVAESEEMPSLEEEPESESEELPSMEEMLAMLENEEPAEEVISEELQIASGKLEIIEEPVIEKVIEEAVEDPIAERLENLSKEILGESFEMFISKELDIAEDEPEEEEVIAVGELEEEKVIVIEEPKEEETAAVDEMEEEEAAVIEEPKEEEAIAVEEPVIEDFIILEELEKAEEAQVEEIVTMEELSEEVTPSEEIVTMEEVEAITIEGVEKTVSPLRITIGEKGNSFIALNLPVEMLQILEIAVEEEETYPVMLLGNYIDCAIEDYIIKYNLLTGEKTRKTVDENVVSLLNCSVSRIAKLNDSYRTNCPDFEILMKAVLTGDFGVLNERLEAINSFLKFVGEDGVTKVKDTEGEIHSMQEVLWMISQNC